ncbi:MAG: gliding motility-associated C-terminal domain-containing protein [Bacteroidetes bacterium]|nr:gliding motility-associated C-terminal domain-containing protein [Bacteroidota bacterium]
MKKILILILVMAVMAMPVRATHNRAGEITLTQLDELTYEITITTFTYTLSLADRDRLEVKWGDNTFSYANRITKTKLPHFYYKNIYVTQHTFPGPGIYEIVVQDPNRNEGVKNIPSSVNVIFSIKTTIMINAGLGNNSTPVLLYPPIDRAAYHQIFIHNPAAYDPDGDSLSYKLTVCTEQDGRPIEGYLLPPASDTLFVDPYTGDLTWITPSDTGIFNIAIDVEEWRSGIKIGNIVRDMQIEVYNTDNHPPVQTSPGNFCVEAGSRLAFWVEATDQDGDSIRQWATGGPFVVESGPATYTKDELTAGYGYTRSWFEWNTNSSHVRNQYYTAVFKAEDNHPMTPLVNIMNVNIKVLGPAPEEPTLIPGSNSVTVIWQADTCAPVRGYQVYRKLGPAGYLPDSCTGGIPLSTGYELVGLTSDRTDTIFVDDNKGAGLKQGNEYCYLIISVYPDGALSFPSKESCTPLVEGAPSILQVSVMDNSASGNIQVAWARPDKLDTIPATGPYEYIIYRSPDLLGQSMSRAGSFTTSSLNDTVWTDNEVNTLNYPWSYSVELYNNAPGNRFLIGTPEVASSIYLRLTGKANSVEIEMIKNVPWINYDYTVYRRNNSTMAYDSIGFTTEGIFIDGGLTNGMEYCYQVKSTGWRILDEKLYENINFSHVNCTIPIDSIPPCPPDFNGYSACGEGYNHLKWEYRDDPPCAYDVTGYRLYFSPTAAGSPEEIARFEGRNDTVYNHYTGEALTGCYYITAIDSFENESVPSVRLCLDECSNYQLPNVFSPNNDGINDIYRPLLTSFVEEVDMKIFNRWGILVFETEDPEINWDGKITGTNRLVSPGVYYYICDVYENRLSGREVTTLTGFVHVYSGEENEPPNIETK